MAGLVATGLLNLGLSFWLALRSRQVTLRDRRRLYGAVWRRLRNAPRSFLLPDYPPRCAYGASPQGGAASGPA